VSNSAGTALYFVYGFHSYITSTFLNQGLLHSHISILSFVIIDFISFLFFDTSQNVEFHNFFSDSHFVPQNISTISFFEVRSKGLFSLKLYSFIEGQYNDASDFESV